MDQQMLWNQFEKTGRVEDYLRYRQALLQADMSAAQSIKETTDGIDSSKGTDRPGTQRGGS